MTSNLAGLRTSCLLLQDVVEPIEQRHPALEQLVVVVERGGERQDRQVHARGLAPRELAVAQIRLVDDLGDRAEAPVPDAPALQERLERAVLALVAELRAEHVERDPLRRRVRRVGELEARLVVEEPFDEPRRRDAVDVRPRPGDPRAARRRERPVTPRGRRPRPRLGGAEPLRRRLPQRAGPAPDGRLEIVHGAHALELALERLEPRFDRVDGPTPGRAVAVELGQHLAAAANDRLVLRRARRVEERRELRVAHGVDAVHPEERRLAAEGLDLLDEPLERLGRLGRLGQDPRGAPELHRAQALELAPHADAVPRRGRGEAQEQRQPAHERKVTLATSKVNCYTPPSLGEGAGMDQTATTRVPIRRLVAYYLRLGAIGFGGPVALCGQMERELVQDRKWVTKDEMREGIAVCQSLPGPLAIQVGIFISYLRGGFWGAWAGGWAFILPTFVMVATLG